MDAALPRYSLENPLAKRENGRDERVPHSTYDEALELGDEMLARPKRGGGPARVRVSTPSGG